MSNTSDKLAVLDAFIEEVNSYLPDIETNLERLEHSPGDMDALEETYRRSHTIGGSASMMDFPGLAHVAHGMEDILGDVLDGLTTLNETSLSILRRSLGRLRRLLEGIPEGRIDQEAVIAEDDADYARYRALLEDSTQQSGEIASSLYSNSTYENQAPAVSAPPSTPYYFEVSPPASETLAASASMPSFEEVLASFRTPSAMPGEDLAWPEDPIPAPRFEDPAFYYEAPVDSASPVVPADQAPQVHQEYVGPTAFYQTTPDPASQRYSEPSTPSALDALMASTQQPASEPASSASPYYQMEQDQPETYYQVAPEQGSPSLAPDYDNQAAYLPMQQTHPMAPTSFHELAQAAMISRQQEQNVLPGVYGDMQQDARSLAAQVSAFKNVATQLRSAMSVIEAQRSEFKSFLDGSKDALDRMEDWAGKAMGLNLRNSPEQVRRYLPLSVMWVSNSKLKKVLDLLLQITSGVEVTDEQIATIFQQLEMSISACGEAFQQVQDQATHVLRQEPGWSPWDMQVARDEASLRERVTFERQGDPALLRNELEAKLRQEISREYESRPISLAVRTELEQQIRAEMRKEFEEKRLLQERVSGLAGSADRDEVLKEIETQLRSQIEIQVRQDFLNQIGGSAAQSLRAPAARDAAPPANFAERAHEVMGSALPAPLPRPTVPLAHALPQAKPAAPLAGSAFSGEFGEEAAEIFRAEAEEHLQNISIYVAALEKDPTNRELIQGIRRATHTLKGAAAMMGFRAIADLSHISEDLLDSIMEGTTPITSAALSVIFDTAEVLDILIAGRDSDGQSDDARVQILRARYVDLLGEQNTSLGSSDDDIDVDVQDEQLGENALVTGVVAGGQASGTNVQRGARGDLSVHVRLPKLDELVNLFGEILVNRSVLEERIQRLVRLVADVGVSSNRLRDVGQKLDSRFEAATLPSGRSLQVMPGEGDQSVALSGHNKNGHSGVEKTHLAEFDELELDRYTEFHQLARGLSEGISDMTTLSTEMDTIIRESESIFARENRLNTTFQDRLMKMRLVPLSAMAPRLYRAGRAVALKQGKDFDFLLEGEATEVDRTVFEEIAGPLLHLIRNAVNHALETPEMRMYKGKSSKGQIKLSAAYEGNQIVITVRDDGTGIDPEGVRRTAIARGLIRPDQVLSEADLIDLIFRPGFSTAAVLSEESGRGVGLDVVRDSVARLRGALAVESTPGQGTAFTMTFPTSLAIQGAMMVKVSGHQFAIPTVSVESIGRLDNFKRTTVAGQPAIQVQSDAYPLHMLAQYLSLPAGMMDEKAQLLLVNTGGNRVALIVDEIKGKSDIVMKNLGPHLRQVHGIAGGTVLGNGQVVLILELNDLLASRAKAGARMAPATPSRGASIPQTPVKQRVDLPIDKQATATMRPVSSVAAVPERGKHILVVDDSPSVRRVVSSMLKQHGWEVQMARDGVEALEMISHETPAAVLLDIEMPRMDGYELISTVRAQEQYRTLPLVVLTSRAAAKHQQRAMVLGASSYVIKPYQDEELINILNSLVYGAVTG